MELRNLGSRSAIVTLSQFTSTKLIEVEPLSIKQDTITLPSQAALVVEVRDGVTQEIIKVNNQKRLSIVPTEEKRATVLSFGEGKQLEKNS